MSEEPDTAPGPDTTPEPEPKPDEPITVVQARPDYIEKGHDTEGLETNTHPAAPEDDR